MPARQDSQPIATVAANDSGRFEDRWVNLLVHDGRCVFLEGIQSLYLPVAHAEGKFVTGDEMTLDTLQAAGHLVIRYVDPRSENARHAAAYPYNPNGSMADVAGVCDETGRVLGMMPHPERYLDRINHPRWTREQLPETGDGLRIFQNAVNYFSD